MNQDNIAHLIAQTPGWHASRPRWCAPGCFAVLGGWRGGSYTAGAHHYTDTSSRCPGMWSGLRRCSQCNSAPLARTGSWGTLAKGPGGLENVNVKLNLSDKQLAYRWYVFQTSFQTTLSTVMELNTSCASIKVKKKKNFLMSFSLRSLHNHLFSIRSMEQSWLSSGQNMKVHCYHSMVFINSQH